MPTPAPAAALSTAAPRLLIIDDDPVVQSALSAWVRTEGMEAETAASVRAAEVQLAAREFDLLLCDIDLPDGSGPELIAALDGTNRSTPVIFLTGNPTLESAIASVRLRVVAYLTKPPDLDELRTLVRREVAASRHRRMLTASRDHLREWDGELARLEQSADLAGPQPLVSYLQLTLRHFGMVIAELDRSVAALGTDESGRSALAQVDLVASLRRTVQVLERSRDHFKSKELGELRKELDTLLRRVAGDGPRGNS